MKMSKMDSFSLIRSLSRQTILRKKAETFLILLMKKWRNMNNNMHLSSRLRREETIFIFIQLQVESYYPHFMISCQGLKENHLETKSLGTSILFSSYIHQLLCKGRI